MIEEGTRLYPTSFDGLNLNYYDEPYAYWLGGEICQWVLYKEYNDYFSTCSPNDCLAGISYEELIESIKESPFYEDADKERLCKTFRQRSLYDNGYNDDFIE